MIWKALAYVGTWGICDFFWWLRGILPALKQGSF